MSKASAAFEKRLKDAKEVEAGDSQHACEAAVLATLARHINTDQSELKWLILGRLDRADLQRSDHRVILDAMKALHDAGDGVDATTVKNWIASRGAGCVAGDIDALYAAPTMEDTKVIETYVYRIVARSRRQQTRRYVQGILNELDDDNADIDDLIAKVQTAAFDLGRTPQVAGELLTAAAELDTLLLDLGSRQNGRGFVGLDTGFGHLNQVINGLNAGLIVFGGPPSSGKTTYIKQLVDQVAERNQIPILFFTFEQSKNDLHIKTLARLAHLNTRDIIKGRTADVIRRGPPGQEKECLVWEIINTAASSYKAFGQYLRIKEADRDTTVARMRVLAQTVKQQTRADKVVVVADYLQIIPVAKAGDYGSTKDRVDAVCSDLRRLARDLNSPVIAVSSENRAGYNRKPTLDVFKESGGIEYGADVAAALWTEPDTADRQFKQNAHRRAVTLSILKNRDGEQADIKMIFDADIATFTEQDKSLRSYTDSLGGN